MSEKDLIYLGAILLLAGKKCDSHARESENIDAAIMLAKETFQKVFTEQK